MKFKTNFTFPFGRLVPVLITAGWCLVFLALAGAAGLSVSAVADRRANPGLKSDLEDLRKSPVEKAPLTAMPSNQDLNELRRRLKELNALEAGGGRSVSAVLSRLEGLLPPGARLLSFQQDQLSGEIQLTLEAVSLEDLSKVLSALENDNAFTKVNLNKQSQSQGGKDHWVQFSVDMVESR